MYHVMHTEFKISVIFYIKIFIILYTYTINTIKIICRIIGELKKCYWPDFKLVVLSAVGKETHACSMNGMHLIWQSLQK